MGRFSTHTGTAVPLRVRDVDTDQIIPARFCTNPHRTGFADGLFADRRTDPAFRLHEARYRTATVLVAAENFGCGSSREAAVWALAEHGIRVVLSSRFGDIFQANAWLNGLLAVRVAPWFVESLWAAIEEDPVVAVTVDLREQRVTAAGHSHPIEVDADTRDRLLRGVDPIGATLLHEHEIRAFERDRHPTPTTSIVFAAHAREARKGKDMSTEESVREMYRCIDANDVATFVSLFTEDAVYHRPGCAVLTGRDEIETYYLKERAIESGTLTVSRVLVSDGAAAVDGSFTGRLDDGRETGHRFAEIFEVAPDGRFSRRDSYVFVSPF